MEILLNIDATTSQYNFKGLRRLYNLVVNIAAKGIINAVLLSTRLSTIVLKVGVL